MRNKIFVILLLIIPVFVSGQIPKAINYQTIARDLNDNILVNKDISIQISIVNTNTGSTDYCESHSVKTNQFGLINIQIGKGTSSIGEFSQIEWDKNSYSAKLEIDENGGTDFYEIGVSQMLSVPYAFYSEKTGSFSNKSGERFIRTFEAMDDLRDPSINFNDGDIIEVLGYYNAHDGGGHKRKIVTTETPLPSDYLISSNTYARIIEDSSEVNVLWFGAKKGEHSETAQGITTNAFVNAINYTEGKLIIPYGKYAINETIEINKQIIIEGVNLRSTLNVIHFFDCNGFKVYKNDGQLYNVQFKNISINYEGSDLTNSVGIDFYGEEGKEIQDALCDNVTISRFAVGIKTKRLWNTVFDNISTSTCKYGMEIKDKSVNNFVSNSTFAEFPGNSGSLQKVIYFHYENAPSEGWTFNNSLIANGVFGFFIEATSHVYINNCIIDLITNTGIHIASKNYYVSTGIQVNNSYIGLNNPAHAGINVNCNTDINGQHGGHIFSNNKIVGYGSLNFGIRVGDHESNAKCIIQGNLFKLKTFQGNIYPGHAYIQVFPLAKECIISNNIVTPSNEDVDYYIQNNSTQVMGNIGTVKY